MTTILSNILSSHTNFYYERETPATAAALLSDNQITPSQFIEFYPDIERTLLTSFLEDDYDGKLHFITLNTTNHGKREVVGIAFWREVDTTEMDEWLDLHRVQETLKRHQALEQTHPPSVNCQDDNEFTKQGRRRMEMIRSDSITWIQNALIPHDNPITSSNLQQMTHAWMKIELIAIQQGYRHIHLGEILFASVLAHAYQYHETHAILHVAGSTSNVAARKLYHKFGFVHVPKYEEGGPFERPDGDLYVLGNIGGMLEKYPWEEMKLSEEFECTNDTTNVRSNK